MEVLVDRHDKVARMYYDGLRSARVHVGRAEVAHLLAENLMHHL